MATKTDWIEGEPQEDGLYAVYLSYGGNSDGYSVIRRESKMTSLAHGETAAEMIYHLGDYKILRHYRLPEPPQPLKLPRRFRAKYNGCPIVGAYFAGSPEPYWFKHDGADCQMHECRLTEIKFEDES